MSFEPVIGLEIHAQLLHGVEDFLRLQRRRSAPRPTRTCARCASACRARCRSSTTPPSTAPCGPRWRSSCTVHATSIFARKNYFYPDLPKGYQISQYEQPLATGGVVARDERLLGAGVRHPDHARPHGRGRGQARCTRASRTPATRSYVDLNRAGTPLIEIVTEPDLRTAADAAAFFGVPARAAGRARRERRQHGRGQPALRRERLGAARTVRARSARRPKSRT